MAGKDYMIEAGFTANDDKKLIDELKNTILSEQNRKTKPIKIQVGQFSQDFTKEFDRVDKIVEKRLKEISKKVQDYTSNIEPKFSHIELFPENQKKVDSLTSRARKKYGLTIDQEDTFIQQLTDRYKMLGRLREISDSQKTVQKNWNDNGGTITAAQATLDLLKEQLELKKKILDVDRQVNKYIPKSDRYSDFSVSDIQKDKDIFEQANLTLAQTLRKQTDTIRKTVYSELKEYEKAANLSISDGKIPDQFNFPDVEKQLSAQEQAVTDLLKNIGLIEEKTKSATDSTEKQLAKASKNLSKYGSTAEDVFIKLDALVARSYDVEGGFYGLDETEIAKLAEMMSMLQHFSGGDIQNLHLEGNEFYGYKEELSDVLDFLNGEMKSNQSIERIFNKTAQSLELLENAALEAKGPVSDVVNELASKPTFDNEEKIHEEIQALNTLSEIKEKIDTIAAPAVSDRSDSIEEVKKEAKAISDLTAAQEQQLEVKKHITDNSPDEQVEIKAADKLGASISDITDKVQDKTTAFKTEANTVVPLIDSETEAAKQLSEQIALIKNSVESISAVKGSTKNPFEKLNEGISGLDIERLEKLASVSDRLSLSLKDLNIGKIAAAGKTGIMSEADMSAESAARIAKLNAEILKTKTSTAEAEAKTVAAEEKAYLEMERHEKAKIEREKAALALKEQKRKIEASISAEKEKQRQDSIRANEEAKAKEAEVALQKELLYLDARQEEYERLRAQYLNDGQKQAEAIVNTIKKQEQAYSDMWKQAENSYNKVWSAQQQGYKNKNKGGETGFFASDPSNLAILEKEMRALANATNGVVPDTIQFNQATKKLSFQTQDAVGNVDKYTISLNNLSNELLQTKTKTIQAIPGTEKFFGFLGTSAKKVASYIFSFGSAYKLWDELKKGISIIKEIDDSMTELKKVSDETATTYAKFQIQAAEAGRKVAQSTSDMIQASADWKKMGYSLQDSLALASASSLYVNVGDNIDITEATSDLISTMKAFNVGADDAISIVDRLNAVSNNFAVTSKDLGDILKHSSSSLAAANTSMDKTIAMGAAMNEVLQDSSIAGSTLKVLSMRLRGAKVELEEAGESTEGMANSTSKLRDQIKALTNVDGTGGFDIMKDDNTFKDIYEQMDGIAEKWKQMDDISRAGLLEKIAGKNRAQGVSALLNNWSEAEAILKTSLESSGSAAKENETYMNSISGKVNQLKAQYQELWQATINDEAIKFFIDLATGVAKLATDIGGLLPVVVALGAAFAGIKFAGKTFRYRDNECALLINAA